MSAMLALVGWRCAASPSSNRYPAVAWGEDWLAPVARVFCPLNRTAFATAYRRGRCALGGARPAHRRRNGVVVWQPRRRGAALSGGCCARTAQRKLAPRRERDDGTVGGAGLPPARLYHLQEHLVRAGTGQRRPAGFGDGLVGVEIHLPVIVVVTVGANREPGAGERIEDIDIRRGIVKHVSGSAQEALELCHGPLRIDAMASWATLSTRR